MMSPSGRTFRQLKSGLLSRPSRLDKDDIELMEK
jgi:hypothetical protein